MSPTAGRRVGVVETTLRDGHQSLWATRMTTAMLVPVLPLLDAGGFETVECMGTALMDAAVRYLKENPFERLRLIRRRVTRTPLGIMAGPVFAVNRQGIVPDDLMTLFVERCVAGGIRRFFYQDGLSDMRNLEVPVRAARACGAFVWGAIVFSISPVHDDAFFARRVRELVALGVDAVTLKDPNGLLTPERVRTLMPELLGACGDLPVYCHSHCNTGMGPASNLEAVRQGAAGIWTVAAPLANGPSLPSTESMVTHLRREGYTVDVDLEAYRSVSEHFRQVASRHGKPLGAVAEYDPSHYRHQLPGGMISNFRSQLADLGIADRFEQVLEEIPLVRADLGWAPMVTPYSQIIGSQATMNVLYGRYEVILDEVEQLLLGRFGRTPGPVDPGLVDRVSRGREPWTGRVGGLKDPLVERMRRELGPFESDDDLLLAAFFMPEVLRELHAAGPIRLEEPSRYPPLVEIVREAARLGVREFSLVRRG